jgi:hypothetical protein
LLELRVCDSKGVLKWSNVALLPVMVVVVGAARQPMRHKLALVLFYGSCTAQ